MLNRLFRHPAFLRALSLAARSAIGRRAVALMETRVLARMLEDRSARGRAGRALGSLFARYEPGRSARDIYADVFAPERFERGYQSQMGQDFFLNKWIFKNGGPGVFVDVGAFDGELGSNTWFFEKRLNWTGVAFEPNGAEYEALRRARSCRAVRGCAYNKNGEVSFLAVSEAAAESRPVEVFRPANLTSLALDPRHGAVMLSGIRAHIENMDRVDNLSTVGHLEQRLVTVPCYRVDSVLDESGIRTVDYLSIDVEGAELQVLQGIDFTRVQVNVIGVEASPCFPEVYDLLTRAGFEYHGLLFFDEVFVNTNLRFTWHA